MARVEIRPCELVTIASHSTGVAFAYVCNAQGKCFPVNLYDRDAVQFVATFNGYIEWDENSFDITVSKVEITGCRVV